MRWLSAVAICVVLLSSTPRGAACAEHPAPADSAARQAAIRQGWPDTDAGLLAARWVRAFSKGEKAMRTLLTEILTPESLQKRSMAERLEGYRAMHERFGELQLVKVVKSSPTQVTAQLAGMDLTPREFTFAVLSDQPGKLAQISYQDFSHGGHGHGFSH